MPINESNATGYNLRRAQAFAAAGINDGDVRYAHPSFVGKSHGDCSLCGKKNIAWLYAIKFDAPDLIDAVVSIGKEITREGEVIFNPVGSECIQTWADPLPPSKEKLDFLLRWKSELAKCNNAKTIQATDSAFKKLGFAGTADVLQRHKVLAAFQTAPLSWYERKALRVNAGKLALTLKLTPAPLKLLAALILKCEAIQAPAIVVLAAPTPPAPPAAPTLPVVTVATVAATVDPVLARAEKLLADPVALGRLSAYDAKVVADITAKVKQYEGKFASPKQRNYLDALVAKAEVAQAAPVQIVEETVEAESIAPVVTAAFVSASKIAGARY